MDVRTMRRVVDDVQAGRVPRVAAAAAARWNAGNPAHVRSSANHVFRLSLDGRTHYLRLTPGSERGPDAIRAELEFVLHAAAAETAVAGVLGAGLAWLDAQPVQEHGLLHGDFELDNLFWDGGRAQVLDFDAAVYGWYGVDVAIALADVWRAGGPDRDRHLAWFFDGYSAVRPLPSGTRAVLPRVVTLSSAVKIAGLLRMYAGTGGAEAPDWVLAMRARHQRWLAARRAELEAT